MKSDSKNRHATSHRAAVLVAMERLDDALLDYQKLVTWSPTDPHIQFSLGETLENLGRNGESLEEYDKITELDPADSHVHFHR